MQNGAITDAAEIWALAMGVLGYNGTEEKTSAGQSERAEIQSCGQCEVTTIKWIITGPGTGFLCFKTS